MVENLVMDTRYHNPSRDASDYHVISMQKIEDFAKWIEDQGGPKKLAAKIKAQFGRKVQISQPSISNWLTRRMVAKDKRGYIQELGWQGPMEWPEEDAPPSVRYATSDELSELKGRVGRLEEDVRALLPLAVALGDLKRQVERLANARVSQE